MAIKKSELAGEIARPQLYGLRNVWQWRPLASLSPAGVADVLRRASVGDGHDFLLAADDVREKDLHYRAVLQTRTLAVSGLPVDIQPYDDSAPAQRAFETVTEALREVDLSALIAHLMDAIPKGYAVAEILWDTSGAVWKPASIAPREAHWFLFDREDGQTLRVVDGSADGAPIAPMRMIVHRPPLAAGIPLLGGVARSALWAWVFKSYALRDWARFCELFGQPIRVGRYHAHASPDDVAVLKRAAFDLGSDAAAVIPQEMALELIESGSKSASGELYLSLIHYLDKQVSKAVLGQTMSTDDGASLSQARVHNEVRRELVEADARAMAATLTRDLIAPIVRVNCGDDVPLPILRLVTEDAEDLGALAGHVSALVAAGMPIPQWWVREKFGIPAPEQGDEILQPPQAMPPTLPGAAMSARPARCDCAAHAQTELQTEDLQAVQLADETTQAWQTIFARIRALVEQADSLETLQAALLMEYGALPTDELAEIMATAFAAADLAGRYEVTNGGRD